MALLQHPALYDDLVDLLAEGARPDRLRAFRLPEEKQARLDELLEKSREGNLTEADRSELDTFEQFEHVVRLLKARVLQKPKK